MHSPIKTNVLQHKINTKKQKAPQGGCGHRHQHARLRYLSEVQKPRDVDLDLGSGQGHINIRSICRTTSVPNHVTVASPSTEKCGHLNVVK